MIIKKVMIELVTEEKVFKNHGILREEIEHALLEGEPKYYKAKSEKYLAFTNKERYLTIIFRYKKGNAIIKTAYPSSKWQIKLYKRK